MDRYKDARIDGSVPIDVHKSWYLWGDVGRGKTHFARALQNKNNLWAIQKRKEDEKKDVFVSYYRIILVNFPKLINRLQNAPMFSESDYTQVRGYIEDNVMSAKYLIIDDLGAEKRTEYTDDYLMRLVEDRYTKELWTGFTSNFAIKELPYEKRIISRISGLVGKNRFEIKGKDRRV